MIYLEAALVVGLLGVVVFLTIRALMVPTGHRLPASTVGVWRVAHHDVKSATLVVVAKLSPAGDVLDEHVVATVVVDDAEYDEKFLSAMAAARQRKALFEAEEQ